MQISLYSGLVALLIVIILWVIAATRKNMDQPVAATVLTALVLALVSLSFFGLSLIILNEKIRLFCHELKFVTLVFLAPCTLMIYLGFTGNAHKLPRPARIALCIIPVLTIVCVFTNNYHHFFRRELYIFYHNGVSYIGTSSGWWYYMFSLYSYILYCIGIGVLAVNYFKRPVIYREQIGFMIATGMAAMVVNASASFGLFPDYGDISLISCTIVCIVQYLTIVRFSRKNVILNAQNLVIGHIDSLVLIFDHKDKLVDSNKDEERISLALKLLEKNDMSQELDGREVYYPVTEKYYSISDRKLYDEKDCYTGRVLMFKNITKLKTAVNELEYITTHDYLTGLMNRRAFRRELLRLSDSSLPAALICVNISGMKLINNIYGYEYGDGIILNMASEISGIAAKRGNSVCARLDADEIGVILKNSDEMEAKSIIQEIVGRLSGGETDKNCLTLETGYTLTTGGDDAEQLFAAATETMRRMERRVYSVSQCFFDNLKESLRLLRDKTGERYQQISSICIRIADRMELSQGEKSKLLLLANMADIGLLSAPAAILQNIGNLTNEQWEEMKLHTVKGHSIALSMLEISEIADEILFHHERYDGYGYPRGLKGADIPLLSRIYAAAEFFTDAPPDQALTLMRSRRGAQFDPEITNIILHIY